MESMSTKMQKNGSFFQKQTTQLRSNDDDESVFLLLFMCIF